MHIGYVLTIIFAAVWLGFKIFEAIKQRKAVEKQKVNDIVDLIIDSDPERKEY